MEALQSAFKQVITLEEWLHHVQDITNESTHIEIVSSIESYSYRLLLSTVYVGVSCQLKTGSLTWSQHSSLREVVLRAIERILKKRPRIQNILTLGYGLRSTDTGAQTGGGDIEITYPNSSFNYLQTKPWETLLNKVGDSILLWLLENTSLFLQISPTCYVQLTGIPVNTILSEQPRSDTKKQVCSPLIKFTRQHTHHINSRRNQKGSPKQCLKASSNERISKSDSSRRKQEELGGRKRRYENVESAHYQQLKKQAEKFAEGYEFCKSNIELKDEPLKCKTLDKCKKVVSDNDIHCHLQPFCNEPTTWISSTQPNCSNVIEKEEEILESVNDGKGEARTMVNRNCGKRKFEDTHDVQDSSRLVSSAAKRLKMVSSQSDVLHCVDSGNHTSVTLNSSENNDWKSSNCFAFYDTSETISENRIEEKGIKALDEDIGDETADGINKILIKGQSDKSRKKLIISDKSLVEERKGATKEAGVRALENSEEICRTTTDKDKNVSEDTLDPRNDLDSGFPHESNCEKAKFQPGGKKRNQLPSREFKPFDAGLILPRHNYLYRKSSREKLSKFELLSNLQLNAESISSLYNSIFMDTKVHLGGEIIMLEAASQAICISSLEHMVSTNGVRAECEYSIEKNKSCDQGKSDNKESIEDIDGDSNHSNQEDHSSFEHHSHLVNYKYGDGANDEDVDDFKSSTLSSLVPLSCHSSVRNRQIDDGINHPKSCGHDSVSRKRKRESYNTKEKCIHTPELSLKLNSVSTPSTQSESIDSKVACQSKSSIMPIVSLTKLELLKQRQADLLKRKSGSHVTMMNSTGSNQCKDDSSEHVPNEVVKSNVQAANKLVTTETGETVVGGNEFEDQSSVEIVTVTKITKITKKIATLETGKQVGGNVKDFYDQASVEKVAEITTVDVPELRVVNTDSTQKDTSSSVDAQDSATDNIRVPVVTEVLPLLADFIQKHRKCPYRTLLQTFCPLRSKKKGMKRTTPVCLPSLLNSHSCSRQAAYGLMVLKGKKVYLFLRCCIMKSISQCFLGGAGNRNKLLKNLKKLLSAGRYDKYSLGQLMYGLKTKSISWLHGFPSNSVKQHLLAKVVYWIVTRYIFVLLRTYFYVTDTGFLKYKLLYYRQTIWSQIHSYGILDLLRRKVFKTISQDEAERLVLEEESLGISVLRFLPKEKSLRPIINMGNSDRSSSEKTISINQQLMAIHSVLAYLKARQPSILGYGKLGTDDLYHAWAQFVEDWRVQGEPKLYFVKTDISRCYDTMKQDKMYNIVEKILIKETSDDELIIRKYTTTKQDRAGYKSRFVRHVETLAEFDEDFITFARNMAAQKKMENTIFMDKVVYQHETTDTLLDRLRKHLFHNIVKSGGHYYQQQNGISQGSIISTLLCSFYYAEMERKYLDVCKNDFLMRIVDDYLYVTPSENQARKFLSQMLAGFSEYSCCTNKEKVLTNFQLSDVVNPESDWFPWCGMLFNTRTCEVAVDYSRLAGISTVDTMTFDLANHPGAALQKKLVLSTSQKCHPVYLDARINSDQQIGRNIYLLCLLASYKLHAYIRRLPHHQRAQNNVKFFCRVVYNVASMVYWYLQKAQKMNDHGQSVLNDKDCIHWICYTAITKRLSLLSSQYSIMLKAIRSRLKILEKNMGEQTKEDLKRIVKPWFPEDFKMML